MLASLTTSAHARYGLEFITFALDTLWLGAPVRPPVLRGLNVSADFAVKLKAFDKTTKKRLRYYARFQPPADGVRLWVRASCSDNGCVAPFARYVRASAHTHPFSQPRLCTVHAPGAVRADEAQRRQGILY